MAERLRTGMEEKIPTYRVTTLKDAPRQRDGHNCGIFVIKASITTVYPKMTQN